MTFDNEDELRKISAIYPKAQLVMRVHTDDTKAMSRLGTKFGIYPEDAPELLQIARDLDLAIVGVSFHVGSACFDASAFSDAILVARQIFDVASTYGFNMCLLDLGGGFPGSLTVHSPLSATKIYGATLMEEIAAIINSALDLHFPEAGSKIRVIAEPGRYFVASAGTLATSVVSKRKIKPANPTDLPV